MMTNNSNEDMGREIERSPIQKVCIEIERQLWRGGYITETEDDREPVWRIIEGMLAESNLIILPMAEDDRKF